MTAQKIDDQTHVIDTHHAHHEWPVLANKESADWEVLTGTEAVEPFSYADVLAAATSQRDCHEEASSWQDWRLEAFPAFPVPSLPSITTERTAKENDSDDEFFDAFFFMDGVKNARGGKSTLMFKGNVRNKQIRSSKKARRMKRDQR